MAFHEDLKNYRLKQNITLEEIADRTKININTLKSFEEGDFGILPTTYVRLFLKAYAKEIGMTEEEVLRNYENEVQFAGQAEAQVRKETARRAEQPSYAASTSTDNTQQRILLNNPHKPVTKKIIISGIVFVVIIIFGKLAMDPSNQPISKVKQRSAPPPLSLFQRADSLTWGLSGLLSDSNSVEVRAKGLITLYIRRDSLLPDTVIVDSGSSYRNQFVNDLDLYAFPSRSSEFILIDQQLQPFNPGTSWTQLKVRQGESTLYSYALK